MKNIFLLLFLLILPLEVFAGKISGKIINGSTKEAAKPERVILFKIVTGMAEVERLENVGKDGIFEFQTEISDDQTMYLVKVEFQGASYNKQVSLDRSYGANLEFEVFSSTQSLENIKISLLHRIVRPVSVQEFSIESTYTVENSGNQVYTQNDENGTFHFFAPKDVVNSPSVMSKNPGSEISTPANIFDATDENHYFVNFPFKPGKSEIIVTYSVPYTNSKVEINEPIFHDFDKFNIFIAPTDVKIEVDTTKLTNKGVIGQIQFFHIQGKNIVKGDKIFYSWSGGDLETILSNQTDEHGHENESKIQVVPNGFNQNPFVASLSIFAVFLLVTGIGINRLSKFKFEELGEKKKFDELKKRKDFLLRKIANLDDAHELGHLKVNYKNTRKELLDELYEVYNKIKLLI
ncbi:hypothetical protein IT568_10470 [bacterium]|nr:hypothetical protein [bacterium]